MEALCTCIDLGTCDAVRYACVDVHVQRWRLERGVTKRGGGDALRCGAMGRVEMGLRREGRGREGLRVVVLRGR